MVSREILRSESARRTGEQSWRSYQIGEHTTAPFRAAILERGGDKELWLTLVRARNQLAAHSGDVGRRTFFGTIERFGMVNINLGLDQHDPSLTKLALTHEGWDDVYDEEAGRVARTGLGTAVSAFLERPGEFVNPAGEMLPIHREEIPLSVWERMGSFLEAGVGKADDFFAGLLDRMSV